MTCRTRGRGRTAPASPVTRFALTATRRSTAARRSAVARSFDHARRHAHRLQGRHPASIARSCSCYRLDQLEPEPLTADGLAEGAVHLARRPVGRLLRARLGAGRGVQEGAAHRRTAGRRRQARRPAAAAQPGSTIGRSSPRRARRRRACFACHHRAATRLSLTRPNRERGEGDHAVAAGAPRRATSVCSRSLRSREDLMPLKSAVLDLASGAWRPVLQRRQPRRSMCRADTSSTLRAARYGPIAFDPVRAQTRRWRSRRRATGRHIADRRRRVRHRG